MTDVENVKDLGSGVIGGVEGDYFAFRAKEVDWQIWIAQGKRPYPCQYVITSKLVAGGPQYSYRIRDWKAGDKAASDDFRFKNPTKAKKVDLKDLPVLEDLPKHFVQWGYQMKKVTIFKRFSFVLLAGIIGLCALELGAQFEIPGIPSVISNADAIVGRPLTPVSVAGVARRTTSTAATRHPNSCSCRAAEDLTADPATRTLPAGEGEPADAVLFGSARPNRRASHNGRLPHGMDHTKPARTILAQTRRMPRYPSMSRDKPKTRLSWSRSPTRLSTARTLSTPTRSSTARLPAAGGATVAVH